MWLFGGGNNGFINNNAIERAKATYVQVTTLRSTQIAHRATVDVHKSAWRRTSRAYPQSVHKCPQMSVSVYIGGLLYTEPYGSAWTTADSCGRNTQPVLTVEMFDFCWLQFAKSYGRATYSMNTKNSFSCFRLVRICALPYGSVLYHTSS